MVVGIITEYNPFHNGHRYQIEEIRKRIKNASIVVLMSGNFTQRGEPAILDKFSRAKLAVQGGCDLVLELPFVNAVRSAQDFACGGVNILKKIGIVDILAFGAEINSPEMLKKAANTINTDNFNKILHEKLNEGFSYANSICQTLSEITGIPKKILRLPNVILAIEYLRAINSTNIIPLLIPRIGAEHNDIKLHSKISSAKSIREAIYLKNSVWSDIFQTIDDKTAKILQKTELPMIENLFRPIITKIICSNNEELKEIYGMNEGLENKIISAAHSTNNLNEFIDSIVSQRYTRTRIQRLLLHFLIGLKKTHIEEFNDTCYARILAFNQKGRELIRLMKKSTNIPIITKITQHINSQAIYNNQNLDVYQKILSFDILSTDIYSILKQKVNLGLDFIHSPKFI